MMLYYASILSYHHDTSRVSTFQKTWKITLQKVLRKGLAKEQITTCTDSQAAVGVLAACSIK